MKEHPDYKYRPRRKPKSLVQKKEMVKYNGFSLDPSQLSRSLLPPPPPLLGSDGDLKFPRLFPPFPYHLGGSKVAADLALQALYGSSLYSHAAAAAVASGWTGPPLCGCPPEKPPSPPGEGPVAYLLMKPEPQHVI